MRGIPGTGNSAQHTLVLTLRPLAEMTRKDLHTTQNPSTLHPLLHSSSFIVGHETLTGFCLLMLMTPQIEALPLDFSLDHDLPA